MRHFKVDAVWINCVIFIQKKTIIALRLSYTYQRWVTILKFHRATQLCNLVTPLVSILRIRARTPINPWLNMIEFKTFLFFSITLQRGKDAQPQQFLIRPTFSSFSRTRHLNILVLSILFFKNLILPDKTIFLRIGPR